MSMLSKFWRGSAKKIIREWYEKERQDIAYKLFGEIETGLDEFQEKLTRRVRERMIRAGVDMAIIKTFENEIAEAWEMYAPDKDKISEKLMAAIDRYMSKKFGYEIRKDGGKI